jgi:zinc protease
VPLVTVEIAVKNGAYTEPPEYNGLSHLYEHMFFKSNEKSRAEGYNDRAGELGMLSNAQT